MEAPRGADGTIALAVLTFNIGMRGNNASGGSTLFFGAFDFSTLFTSGKGVKFPIGAWNGGEAIYFNGTSCGINGAKPETYADHTYDSIDKTWRNWGIIVDSIGLHV